MKKDHRIFGYEKPNLASKKLLLFSIFTNDVSDNPFGFPLGAYYDTMEVQFSIKYLNDDGNFIKTILLEEGKQTIIYFDKKWIQLDL